MKELFIKYRNVVRFVLLFLGSYLLLSFGYAQYLKLSASGNYAPDFITHIVAQQSKWLLEAFGYAAELKHDAIGQGMLLLFNHSYTVSIVEGCNSVSVIILFFAFVIAFAESFKKTISFLLAGAILIYIVNVLRIVILVVALYNFPQHKNTLHSVVFPGIIYGIVFVLWMIWVKMLKPNSAK